MQYRKHPELVQQLQARAMALQGRGGDTEVAHVTVGEIVLPKALQARAVLEALRQAAGDAGIPLAHFRVGSGRNSINPQTGQPEFSDESDEDVPEEPAPEGSSPQEPSSETSSPEAPMEEITVTAPRETGLVQLSQNLPEEFRVYGTPLRGQGQYGVPAAMAVIGAASKAWIGAGNAPFNVGNMSKEDGAVFPPHTGPGHRNGTGIDIRPVRTDGKNASVTYKSPDYDRAATQQLVDTLRATGGVQAVYFNDPEIKGVTPDPDGIHDNHLHVQVDPNWRRSPGR